MRELARSNLGGVAMLELRRFLFPFDFSEAAKAMVPTVIAMARRFDASVTMLNAFDLVRNYDLSPLIVDGIELEASTIPYTEALQTLRDQRERKLEEFARAELSMINCTTRMGDGDPDAVIDWTAKHEQSDLIVMPTRGLGRFRSLLLGSVAAKVIHDAGCPVLTSAHQPASSPTAPQSYQSILCVARFNPGSEEALRVTRFLAHAYQARVCLLYLRSFKDTESEESATRFIQDTFERTESPGGNNGPPPSVRILDTGVADGVRQTAIEQEADLIVVGRGHFNRDLSSIWSDVYTIICESPCPVITV